MTITPSDAQAAVIRQIADWYMAGDASPQEFYLAGYAGVGKTTIAKMAEEEIRNRRHGWLTVCVGAYTGKAANVLRKKGNPGASTIHSMIYVPKDVEGKTVWVLGGESAPAALADLIILDEVSMVDTRMANDVRSFKKKILVMGDPAQLPPVGGAGAFLTRDPDAFLTEIHRQAAESPILRIATMLRQGQMPDYGCYGDGVVIAPLTATSADLVYRPETQAIVAINRVRMTINQQIRRLRGFEGELPLAGERVMCCRNNRDLAIFNGGLGEATTDARRLVDGLNIRMSVQMEDVANELKLLPMNPALFAMHFDQTIAKPEHLSKGIELFDWGYTLTCHKAQGSEFDDATIIDDAGAFRADQWKWRYTAVTRASERLAFLRRR